MNAFLAFSGFSTSMNTTSVFIVDLDIVRFWHLNRAYKALQQEKSVDLWVS